MTIGPPSVRLLICGTADRGDDGAALAAAAHLLPSLPADVQTALDVRRCSQLDAADLIDVGPDERCLIVDSAIGIVPGSTVVRPLRDLVGDGGTLAPRSSHALPAEQVLLLVEAVRGSLPDGSFVGIGGKWFGFGRRFSVAVRLGLPEFEAAIAAELVRLARSDPLAALSTT
jgi:Ni,Fe-hydrogenase maturation factor